MTLSVDAITFDCADAVKLAAFWSAALDATVNDDASAEFASISTPDGRTYCFIAVPEAKAAKNRVHLDLSADDRDAEVERLLGLGATVHASYDEGGNQWTTLLDIEGNEFCVAG